MDHDEFRGEVIFTFDGDAAGQKAALRAFEDDQKFVGQTYVAVEPDGLDPCDLRLQQGDAAVRELVARRIPLYRFVLGNVVCRYDLDRADGRVDAVREAAKLVSAIRDQSKVEAFARELAGMVGVDIDEVRAEVAAPRTGAPTTAPLPRRPRPPEATEPQRRPRRRCPTSATRGSSSSARPSSSWCSTRRPSAGWPRTSTGRLHPSDVPRGLGGRGGGRRARRSPRRRGLGRQARDSVSDPAVVQALSALAVEPLQKEPTTTDAAAHVFRLQEITALRRITELKSRLQRTNPIEQATEYNRMFGELVALEAQHRTLREKAIGGEA